MVFRSLNRIFATMNNTKDKGQWSENVIVVDGNYVDRVAFDLIVNFERMLGRRIPQADLARWIDCVALDGGLLEGENQTSVVFIHDPQSLSLENFTPANYSEELNGKAFNDVLGEFTLSAFPAVEGLVKRHQFVLDVVLTACSQPEVKRVMVVADTERHYDELRQALRDVDDEKRVTVFAMQPLQGGNFRQEILGYSLMQALGIKAAELENPNP